jgi:hypothetical protein
LEPEELKMNRAVLGVVMALVLTATASAAPPRLGQLDQLPQRGTWKMGIFEPRGQDMDMRAQYYGLRHTDTWLDLFVRDAAGEWYVTAQHMVANPDGTMITNGVLLNLGLMSQPAGIAMIPNPAFRHWSDGATQALTGDDHVQWGLSGPFAPETLIYGPARFDWKSTDGAIDLTGELVAPGSWYYLPTPTEAGDELSEMYYANQYYKVAGTYSGADVTGYVIIENLWGNVRYDDTWWVNNRAGNWTAWTTSYDDGTTEYGQFFVGPYGARGGVISNDKGELVLQSNQINGTIDQRDAVETPQHIHFEFGNGDEWEYVGDPTATILPQIGLGTSLSNGVVHRVGETRKITSAHAVQLTAHDIGAPQQLVDDTAPLRIGVRPRRIRAGHRTRLRLVVRRGTEPVAGVTITVAGKTRRTDARGRARISVTPTHRGSLRIRATLDSTRATARVRVLRRRGPSRRRVVVGVA